LARFTSRRQSFERGDFRAAGGRDRRRARADRSAVEVDRAGAALRETAAEAGAGKIEIVTQNIEQRRFGLGAHPLAPSVECEFDRFGHGVLLLSLVLPELLAALELLLHFKLEF